MNYSANPLVAAAAADLSKYAAFTGPKQGGAVTPATIFRGFTDGDTSGPYVSEFLLHDVPYGSQLTPATVKFGYSSVSDYLTDPAVWLEVQNGKDPGVNPAPIEDPLHLYNARQLAQYVHIDELFQAYLNACLLLITPLARGGFNAPIFALKGGRTYEFDSGEFGKLQADVLGRVLTANGNKSYLLPMAYPEGCPLHPAYAAGHPTVAGACVTVLKAIFYEDAKLSGLKVPTWSLPQTAQTCSRTWVRTGTRSRSAENSTSWPAISGWPKTSSGSSTEHQ